ncbi:CHASE2 domain-containing serine/threonine-protein kinase [Acidovorax radicis]|uniref:CHASE2 domain-containing serine/threonine-protein kinase n=1 Tax=Acidovorax radicis TaxID=758826 RepID=UPI001CF919DE|nr:serine/threonine-protein kinase [Acidovorax radicis]
MGRRTSARRLNVWRTDGFLSALIAVVAAVMCAATGVSQRLEYALYDAANSVSSPAPLAEIAIVGIDEASLAALGEGPWSNDIHARLIDRLAAAGAKTIVYTPDLTTAHDNTGLAYVRRIRQTLATASDESPLAAEVSLIASEADAALDTDARLASAIQKAGNVLLASRYADTGTPTALPAYAVRSTLPNPGSYATQVQSAQHPVAAFGAVAAGVGHLYADADMDGQVRQIPLLLQYDNAGVPALSLLAAQHSLHLGPSDLRIQTSPPGLLVGGLSIPTNSAAVMRPRAQTLPDGSPAFPASSFVSVLEGKTPPGTFKDKIVLVGASSGALAVPWAQRNGVAAYPIELLAQTVSSLRQGLGVRAPAWASAACGVAVAAVLFLIALMAVGTSALRSLAAGSVLLLVLVGLETSLLRFAGIWVPLVLAMVALVAGVIVVALLQYKGRRAAHSPADAAEADRMMGLALQGQGHLERAFERLRKVPPSDALLDNLYHLAEDFERKRKFAKAKVVYEHILRHNRHYKDARSRYTRARANAQTADTASSTPPISTQPPVEVGPQLAAGDALKPSMLGRYQLDREIGKGAMGVVYLGRDPKIGRVVAIKTLALGQEFEGDALIDARARFFREAESAGRLQHPHIVTIFDAGEERNLAYIAMEFLKGSDLTHACSHHALLPVSTVLSIAARVADALDYAHAHHVVHRDIKPANIMFDAATDAVKVTDFGIARITDSSRTRTGLVLGTPSFMSPEQLAGKKIDGRSDLYSLGVTVFQLLTGSLPLRGESLTELMHKITSVEAPDIRQMRPELSSDVAQTVAMALQKKPEARYQTGLEFAAALRQAAAGPSAAQKEMPTAEAVVYDAHRDASGHEMVDFQETVMEPPVLRGAAALPISGAQ